MLRAALAVVSIVPLAGGQTFLPPVGFPVGGSPRGIAVGDFDGDGTPDVAVALFDANAVAVLAGAGGALGAPVPFTVPARPWRVAAGDVDGDGDLDLAVVHQSASHTVSVLLGNGDGTFAAHLAGPVVPAAPSAVALADLDGDGRADLIVGAAGSSGHLYPALGGGAFGPVTSFDFADLFPGSEVAELAVGDVDDDGDLDVLVAGEDDGTHVVMNQGGFAFTHHGQAAWWGYETFGVDLADVDQDGTLDLLWIEGDGIETGGELRHGHGNGTWGSPETTAIFAELDFVRFAQLDVDGDPDHVGAHDGFGGQIAVRYTFGAPGVASQGFFTVTVPGNVEALETFDLDGDGFEEVVLGDAPNQRLVLLPNVGCPGPGTLASATPDEVPQVAAPASVLELAGCELDAVTSVTVGGAPAAFDVAPGGRTMTVTVPQGFALGAATVALEDAGGVLASYVLGISPAFPPALALEPAGDLSVATPAVLHLGAGPGDLALLFVSSVATPSVLPGVIDLAIGNGFTNLVQLASFALPAASGAAALPLAAPPALVGATFHLQAAVLDSSPVALPLVASNVATVTVVP